MRVVLVDDDTERLALLDSAMSKAGHQVVGKLHPTDDLIAAVDKLQPDIVLIDVNSPSRDTLESLGQIITYGACSCVEIYFHNVAALYYVYVAVAAGYLMKASPDSQSCLLILGGLVTVSAVCAIAVRFTAEHKTQEQALFERVVAERQAMAA